MKNRYRAGANFERRVRKDLENKGWVVFRSAGSHSPADLIALRFGEVMLVQCQVSKPFSIDKGMALELLKQELGCQICFAWRENRQIKMELLG